MMKTKKMLCAVVMVMMLAIMFTVPAFAAGTGDVAGAIEGTWTEASAQIKHGQFEWTAPAILFACLIFTLTAPTYVWTILGM